MILRVLNNPETSHFPETGFVYNSIEASDVLVCWYHVSSEGEREREVWHQLWDRWLSALGWIPGFRVQTADKQGPWLYLLLSWAQTQEQDTQGVPRTPCCSSSLTACVMTVFISIQANTKHMLLVRESQPAKLVLLSQVRWDDSATVC